MNEIVAHEGWPIDTFDWSLDSNTGVMQLADGSTLIGPHALAIPMLLLSVELGRKPGIEELKVWREKHRDTCVSLGSLKQR